MSEELEKWGFPVDPAERMQQVMLGLYDLLDEGGVGRFSSGFTLRFSTSCA